MVSQAAQEIADEPHIAHFPGQRQAALADCTLLFRRLQVIEDHHGNIEGFTLHRAVTEIPGNGQRLFHERFGRGRLVEPAVDVAHRQQCGGDADTVTAGAAKLEACLRRFQREGQISPIE